MKHDVRALSLRDAPLRYAPRNELGVVYLFAHVAQRLQLRVEEIRPGFPDCIAYRHAGDVERKLRIEFEFRSSSFKNHGHNPKHCDCIVCWHHDWPEVPRHIEVIELKNYFGVASKVWIQPVIKSQWDELQEAETHWGLSKRTSKNDLLLMYRCSPECAIHDIYQLVGPLKRGRADWRDGDCYLGRIRRVCSLRRPVSLDELRTHPALRNSTFVRRNMQGNLMVSEYWSHLYDLICDRNPTAKRQLRRFAPESM